MPQWLCNQLMHAFYKKDRRQVKLLNDCWFFYRSKLSPGESGNGTEFQ
ncbi:hypothetical protein FHS15_003518 [Paenibacillus castaneae]|nr:cortex morphogenetic protein CmpA [Paenibacillus castaneae]NIK78380.1 hypothetical protein [Paenibacillus castaneae]